MPEVPNLGMVFHTTYKGSTIDEIYHHRHSVQIFHHLVHQKMFGWMMQPYKDVSGNATLTAKEALTPAKAIIRRWKTIS